jgi:hypothetical protein
MRPTSAAGSSAAALSAQPSRSSPWLRWRSRRGTLLPALVLGGPATVAAVLRILLAGRYRGLFAAVTCGLVMHPASTCSPGSRRL